MRRSVTISAVGHVAVLAWALVSLPSSQPLSSVTSAVDLVSADEFTRLTGSNEETPTVNPTPIAEKIGEEKPIDDPNAKIVENKKEVTAATEETALLPETKPPEPKPPEPKAEPQADPIAEAIKKDEVKKPEPPKPPQPKPQPKKEVKQQQKFDPRKVAALLDKRDPQRQAAAGATVNKVPSRGAQGAASHKSEGLSALELSGLESCLRNNWKKPADLPEDTVFHINFDLKPDATLASTPTVDSGGSGPVYRAAEEAGMRAILMCQPYTMLNPSHYEAWHSIDATFVGTDKIR